MRKCTRVHCVDYYQLNGEGPIGRKEVAKLAGVSEATVSRVLNGVGPLKEDTRKRVDGSTQQLNYVPSALAQHLPCEKAVI